MTEVLPFRMAKCRAVRPISSCEFTSRPPWWEESKLEYYTACHFQLVKMTISFDAHVVYYRVLGKFGGELNLAVWRSDFVTVKLKSANISYLHIYVWQSLTKPPNLNQPIFLQWRFWAQPPNLIPTNTSGYTVFHLLQVIPLLNSTSVTQNTLHMQYK